jgi:hypothetical protein
MPDNNDKPVVRSIEKTPMSSSGYTDPGDYEDFVHNPDLEKIFGGTEMNERALYRYVRKHYPEVQLPPLSDDPTVDDIEDALMEANVGQRDNTYNWSWWGPTLVFQLLGPATDDPYNDGVIIVSPHMGGDVRGNYGSAQAFRLETYAEEVPWYDVMLTVSIETDRGRIVADSSDIEAYDWYIHEDETGTWEEGENITGNELESALDWQEEGVYLW